jgi:hypothetical protein
VKVEVLTEEYASTGSGVIINHIGKTNTIILTAGHICHDNTVAMRVLDIKENSYMVVSFFRAKDDDLCLLVTDGTINGKPIKVSDTGPQIGDHAYNIAAPMGIHAPDMELMFDGYYQGKLKIPQEMYPNDIYSIAGMGGSSGSPIFNDNWEITGIVSRGIPGFQHIMMSVSHERILAFYKFSFSQQFIIESIPELKEKQKKFSDLIDAILGL